MWSAGLAGDLLWLQFGQERITIDLAGIPRTVGAHALHVSAPWRWVEAWGDVRADHCSSAAELGRLGTDRPICENILAQDSGTLQLRFSDGSCLHVEAEGNDEYWRLLQPGRDDPHFVVGPWGSRNDA